MKWMHLSFSQSVSRTCWIWKTRDWILSLLISCKPKSFFNCLERWLIACVQGPGKVQSADRWIIEPSSSSAWLMIIFNFYSTSAKWLQIFMKWLLTNRLRQPGHDCRWFHLNCRGWLIISIHLNAHAVRARRREESLKREKPYGCSNISCDDNGLR